MFPALLRRGRCMRSPESQGAEKAPFFLCSQDWTARMKGGSWYRREKVAVIYQAFHLFPLLTALENVRYPLEIQGMSRKEAGEQAKEYLNAVGIGEEKFGKYPRMMSGGEQQRTAIARAMASGGKIVLADEPTGNLDTENEENVVELLGSLAHDRDFTVILVTHNREIAERADVQMVMKDGRLTVKHGL